MTDPLNSGPHAGLSPIAFWRLSAIGTILVQGPKLHHRLSKLHLSEGKVHFSRLISQHFLCAPLGLQSGRFVDILGSDRRIRQDRNTLRLNLNQTSGNIEGLHLGAVDLKNFVEPRLPRTSVNDLELPDCQVGFYDSLVAFDHLLGKAWIISTGLAEDGSRSDAQAAQQTRFWLAHLQSAPAASSDARPSQEAEPAGPVTSDLTAIEFLARVGRIQRYIHAGDIYQANLSHRLTAPCQFSGWELYEKLAAISPAPFSAYLDCGDFQIASSSPELFLRLSGCHIRTRPIKGTRPRSPEPDRDAQLSYELQTSPKEMAELVMITDLLRNDLGRVCEYGSVSVPELVRLERYPQVQHLVSTVEGRLRPDVTHFAAFAACFPGGSITGAPKIRAMEIIDELEPVSRGPYTGALGYLGFNRESQLSIAIRTAVVRDGEAHFHAGAGIVADSVPAAEYQETLTKAGGFLAALSPRARSLPVATP